MSQLPFDSHNTGLDPSLAGEKQEALSILFHDLLKQIAPGDIGMGVEETPKRASRMWLNELTRGYHQDIKSLFRLFPTEGYEGIVVVRDIPIRSTCVHHLVPFVGYASIGYVPDKHVIGLSKLPRLVDAFSRRLQIQENLNNQILEALRTYLQPKGAIVLIASEHMCMTLRGVQAPGTMTITSDVFGVLEEEGYKNEFFKMINNGGRV